MTNDDDVLTHCCCVHQDTDTPHYCQTTTNPAMAVMIMATTTRGTVIFVCVMEEASDAAVSAVFISVVVVEVVVSEVTTGVATGGRSVIVGVGAVPSSSVTVVLPSSALALALISSSILSAGVAIFSSIGGVVWGASDVAVTVTDSSSPPVSPPSPASGASSAPPVGTPTGSRSPRSGLNMGSLLSGVLLLVVVEAASGSAAGSSSPSH
mmetsp:Transcript_48327/g.54789  ORF Transcript_48327/g.54789 Transcript_48327/m.54789 type:complete len:209 (-) Transcript_48327:484-1110(-)